VPSGPSGAPGPDRGPDGSSTTTTAAASDPAPPAEPEVEPEVEPTTLGGPPPEIRELVDALADVLGLAGDAHRG
jgi:hypothetical protein